MSRTALITLIAALAALAPLSGAAAAAPTPTATPAPAVVASLLTRIYRGDDGGVLYLRQLGGTVYGFGEHPGRKYAYVLTGTVGGDLITGSWWDVPKGARDKRGSLRLRFAQFGATLVRSGGHDLGPQVFTAIPANGIPWPNRQAAGFQATRQSDLDGAFLGDDASRHYVREIAGDVVWVGERAAQPQERPGWATVFVGTRKSNGAFAGTYVDVPKGLASESGPFGAAFVGAKRELMLSQPGVDRTDRLAPDYALDWDRFASGISGALSGNAVGWAYGVAHEGAVLRSGAGGARRTAADGGRLAFTTKTRAQTASAAKTINAAALLKALREAGLDVDTKVQSFLPSCWQRGTGVATLTFRQILNHTSGLPKVSCNFGDGYECLVKMIKAGRTEPRTRSYNTHAYDLLRFLVPAVVDRKGTMAQVELLKCKNTAGVLNRKVSERFVRYVFRQVLEPIGVEASYHAAGEFSLNYDEDRPALKGDRPRDDFFVRGGSGKLAMSAVEYVRFLSALDRGLIVPKGLVESMKGSSNDNRLGFDSSVRGVAGEYHRKTGSCPDFPGTTGGCKTVAVVFPGDVQVYVTTNSTNNDYTGSLTSIVVSAFENALR